ETQSRPFNIASQPVVTALDAFSETTGIQIFYSSELASGRISPGVSGNYAPHAALEMLLIGTHLTTLATGDKAVTLVLDQNDPHSDLALLPSAPTLSLASLHVDPSVTGDYRL